MLLPSVCSMGEGEGNEDGRPNKRQRIAAPGGV